MTNPSDIEKRLDKIEANQAEILGLLRMLANPATALSVEQKADELRKALATGDKRIVKEVARRISGY
jgi:hypothetical protein